MQDDGSGNDEPFADKDRALGGCGRCNSGALMVLPWATRAKAALPGAWLRFSSSRRGRTGFGRGTSRRFCKDLSGCFWIAAASPELDAAECFTSWSSGCSCKNVSRCSGIATEALAQLAAAARLTTSFKDACRCLLIAIEAPALAEAAAGITSSCFGRCSTGATTSTSWSVGGNARRRSLRRHLFCMAGHPCRVMFACSAISQRRLPCSGIYGCACTHRASAASSSSVNLSL
mmetsp:Transcript_70226/g.195452  ORF Transcript_70226/g.195452 Transcript_70226/m.195452 type:complete len:232 (+) Transcript_70226:444-1139(+)